MILFKFLGKIIMFIIKEIVSFFIKFFLLIVIVLVVIGLLSKNKDAYQLPKNKFFVEINLAEQFNEKSNASDLLGSNDLTFYTLIKALRNISSDSRVQGLFLQLDNVSLNAAQREEFLNELEHIKANSKEIIAYMENANTKNYVVASAATKIFMPKSNATFVNISPYSTETMYIKDFIDKLGVKFNVINIGDYKSYGENLSKNFMSEENRMDTTRILDKNYNYFLDIVSKNRKLDKNYLNKIIEDGDLVAASSNDLLKNKLIDDYLYLDEIKNEIGKDNIVNISEYLAYIPDQNKQNKIALITLEGNILESESINFSEKSIIFSSNTIEELEKAEKDENVKGIVLRINSPGGSALASDKISRKIREISQKKPIYVSMSGVAASGGYYIASSASKIFADKNTVTGSIGVVSILADFTDLLKKLEINNEKISRGKFSDLYSSTDFNEEKYEKLRISNLKTYEDFLQVVSEGRKINLEILKKYSEGRVWIGEEAVQINLVDSIGGLQDTIENIAKDLNITNDYSVEVYKDSTSIIKNLKKYKKFIKEDKFKLLEKEIYDAELYNRPSLILPYEILN